MQKYHIGITGLIGAGKSTISKVFATLSYPVYNTDNQARYIIFTEEYVISKLKAKFGKSIYYDNNTLNKSLLREIIFNDEQARLYVNSIVHPFVIDDYKKWRLEQNNHLCFIESALLFESKIYQLLDYIIIVESPYLDLINRIQERDNLPLEKSQKILESQILNWQKFVDLSSVSCIVIHNDDNHSIISQCLSVINTLK